MPHATGMQHPHGEGKANWEASPLHQRNKGHQAALLPLPLPEARMKAATPCHSSPRSPHSSHFKDYKDQPASKIPTAVAHPPASLIRYA